MKKTEAETPPKVVSIESLRAKREADRREETADSTERDREALLDELQSELEDLPDVRLDKVIEAKLRISRGYYDTERVRLDILGALFEEERGESPSAASGKQRAPATDAGKAGKKARKKTAGASRRKTRPSSPPGGSDEKE